METWKARKFKEQFGVSFSDGEGKLFHEFEYYSILNLVEGEDFYKKEPFIVFNSGKTYQWNKNGEVFDYVGKYNAKRFNIIFPE